MARKKKLDFSDITDARKKKGVNQKDFWARYGVTQSGGSRYESGRNIPKPLAILLWLHRSGKVTDKDLADALK
jgi:DNA-binding transcriptional regulator YiaG